jgi:hypothetical protein
MSPYAHELSIQWHTSNEPARNLLRLACAISLTPTRPPMSMGDMTNSSHRIGTVVRFQKISDPRYHTEPGKTCRPDRTPQQTRAGSF